MYTDFKIGPLDFIYLYKRCRNNFDPIVLCLKLALKSGKLEEYKVAKAIIQYALPGLLVTKWPCLRGQSVRTGQKIVRGDKFVFKHSSNQQRLVQGVLVLTLKFEIPQVACCQKNYEKILGRR